MEPIKYRCKLCSSEILGNAFGSSDAVCMLCRLSAEEAHSTPAEAPRCSYPTLRLPLRLQGSSSLGGLPS